jgi:mitochondrial protein MBA1
MNATVVNDVVGQLPMASDALLRQCTVRIKSVQEYRKKRGQQIQTKAVTEYIVMQKMIWQGEDEPWKIWGTVEPSTEKEITELFDEERAQGGLADRVRSLMPNVGGGGPMM